MIAEDVEGGMKEDGVVWTQQVLLVQTWQWQQ
jgi:hypothetical protein